MEREREPAICPVYGSSEQKEEHDVQNHVASVVVDQELQVCHWPVH